MPLRRRALGRGLPFGEPSEQALRKAADRAQRTLWQRNPLWSAKTPAGFIPGLLATILALGAIPGAIHWVSGLWAVPLYILSGCFCVIGIVRLIACVCPAPKPFDTSRIVALDLAPVWTILIAVYKEKDSIRQLLEALAALDWPKDKLDILSACEADDEETIQALLAVNLPLTFRLIRVPKGGPRTKPNALQTALPFARGRFLTVYDAEDRPHPLQLRDAFSAFAAGPSTLAVVQAPLVTDNERESWIAQQFALDYAIWFRVMLPALARLSGLLPLGGTSNHFRISALHSVGGWDPWNVTEDADLGIRLARQGYSASLISTPTYEEAPPRLQGWIRQRGRWIQGHLQTVGVHCRQPVELARSLGVSGLCAFWLGLCTGPLSALALLPFWLMALWGAIYGLSPLMLWGAGFGALAHVAAAVIAIMRDGRGQLWPAVLCLPLYHVCQLPAVARALFRVTFTPSIWDKTDHGAAARTQWTGQRRSSS